MRTAGGRRRVHAADLEPSIEASCCPQCILFNQFSRRRAAPGRRGAAGGPAVGSQPRLPLPSGSHRAHVCQGGRAVRAVGSGVDPAALRARLGSTHLAQKADRSGRQQTVMPRLCNLKETIACQAHHNAARGSPGDQECIRRQTVYYVILQTRKYSGREITGEECRRRQQLVRSARIIMCMTLQGGGEEEVQSGRFVLQQAVIIAARLQLPPSQALSAPRRDSQR